VQLLEQHGYLFTATDSAAPASQLHGTCIGPHRYHTTNKRTVFMCVPSPPAPPMAAGRAADHPAVTHPPYPANRPYTRAMAAVCSAGGDGWQCGLQPLATPCTSTRSTPPGSGPSGCRRSTCSSLPIWWPALSSSRHHHGQRLPPRLPCTLCSWPQTHRHTRSSSSRRWVAATPRVPAVAWHGSARSSVSDSSSSSLPAAVARGAAAGGAAAGRRIIHPGPSW
jgi:hypothetical protein